MHPSLGFILSLAVAAVATPSHPERRTARHSSPDGCLTVGKGGKFHKVQDAVDALDKSNPKSQCIYIAKGKYQEQVTIEKIASPLIIYGETSDTSDYNSNAVTITQGRSQDNFKNENDKTATLRAHTPNLKVYNINLVNTRGAGSQALAVSASGDKQAYYACQLIGYQDTVLAQTGKQLYAKCYIEGATDFIFGEEAFALFHGCTIGVLPKEKGKGHITANGADDESNKSIFVIENSSIAAARDKSVKDGSYTLGRPWGHHARTVFQNCDLSAVINEVGWSTWNDNDPRNDYAFFGEYGNTGKGALGKRPKWVKQLKKPIAITEVLDKDYKSWTDASYLG
ncbi:hypothetical protein IAQ61_002289 [Plenodomus lingam]|uniref:Pectinesterase n=1 Tax=Leptosphaeria maculans (strain JN3 / isolate v23.1.3 / race Av1-4-5-6-7-8) TaxID=985895 RepID=E4ZHH5_LEPMJ|nr:similar to carbohydrate esterase family 8 protein [Plenodomus lingam JN3]KAH9876928.1 hypothetical protein IAQ61_002289 [Plenodomus lingam]CBX90808.1 similar to carbohydrate esterase family 8 protein [Plenodomus lingam JN3]